MKLYSRACQIFSPDLFGEFPVMLFGLLNVISNYIYWSEYFTDVNYVANRDNGWWLTLCQWISCPLSSYHS